MNRRKILVVNRIAEAGLALLKDRTDIDWEVVPDTPLPDFLRKLDEAAAVTLGATRFGKAEIAAAPRLEVCARIGVGYDAVDVPSLTARKIPLMVAGIANSPSVAEHAMFLMLSLARKWSHYDRMVRNDRAWAGRFADLPVDLYGKTVLVVGFGRIGMRTARRCRAFDMQVLVYDPYLRGDTIRGAECVPVRTLEEGLAQADFVTIHCPKTPETVGLFNARTLGAMKRGAILVNTARGGIIDEAALHAALTSGHLAAAGLDVFEKEPSDPDNPLFKLDNVLLSPHMAGVTVESSDRMAMTTIQNVLDVFDGRPNPDNVINREVLTA
jgi:D-3-phosphoglycerate dehydrogenase